jgi:broad specificity phosphatase PhoE
MGLLTFVRHGQASFLADNYDKLSDLGEDQARRLGEYWADRAVKIDTVYAGPLVRQRTTADRAAEAYAHRGLPWPEVHILDDLEEFPADTLGKKIMPQLIAEDPAIAQSLMAFQNATETRERERHFQRAFEIVADYWIQGRFDDDVESWKSFQTRVERALTHMTSDAHRGQHVVAFTSGGPTALAARYALDATPKAAMALAWTLRNGSISEFLFSNDRFTLQTYNGLPYLNDPAHITHR